MSESINQKPTTNTPAGHKESFVMTQVNTDNPKSACCDSSTRLGGGAGDFSDSDRVVTQYYVCNACNGPCDLKVEVNTVTNDEHTEISPELGNSNSLTQKLGISNDDELRAYVQRYAANFGVLAITNSPSTDDVMKRIELDREKAVLDGQIALVESANCILEADEPAIDEIWFNYDFGDETLPMRQDTLLSELQDKRKALDK